MKNKRMNQSRMLSVVLAVFNEEKAIKDCLESVQDLADEIVIVDGSSTDNTVLIAKKFDARIIKTSNKPMFHTNKQIALEAAKFEWVLQLDADEVVDRLLREKIRQIVSEGSQLDGYWIKRKNYFLGRFLTKGGQYPDKVIRFVRKGKASFPQKSVHEQIWVKGKVGEIEGHLLHYNAPTFSRYIINANRYTTLTAKNMFTKRVRLTFLNDLRYLLYYPMVTFITLFFRHRGYVDGFPGFVFALFSGLHFMLAYMKLGDEYRYEHLH